MNTINKKQKRTWALSNHRVNVGVWGFKISLFKEITLTTRESDMLPGKNGVKKTACKFGKDFQRLIKYFRDEGYEIEYCGCFELSPDKKLLHWHGLLRIKYGYFPISRRELGDLWNKYHNAFAVSIKNVYDTEGLKKYVIKHLLKEYLNQGLIRNKFLVSKGWSRYFVKELESEFKRWWVNGCEAGSWMSTYGYRLMNQTVQKWCEKGIVGVYASWGRFIAKGDKIDAEIFGEEVK